MIDEAEYPADGIHLETVSGGVEVTGTITGVQCCCNDCEACFRPSWGSAYWHAVYRARRTRRRQYVGQRGGRWFVDQSAGRVALRRSIHGVDPELFRIMTGKPYCPKESTP